MVFSPLLGLGLYLLNQFTMPLNAVFNHQREKPEIFVKVEKGVLLKVMLRKD